MASEIQLIANGDLRLGANRVCWPAQKAAEDKLIAAVEKLGHTVVRAHEFDAQKQHGFIDSQKRGLEVFRSIKPKAPVIVCEAVWQYSQHILAGLMSHQGPILTVANWSGQWPGLVGMLNLNGSLTKAGVEYSTIWSENFDDAYFVDKLGDWLSGGHIKHSEFHVKEANDIMAPHKAALLAKDMVKELLDNKAIMGVFDEGCMGMYNAILPDELLARAGVFKERLSQSALYAEMLQTSDEEAQGVRSWLEAKGMKFNIGADEATELTETQIRQQCKLYIAALRIADDYGCAALGIQYQQGLKDLCPASDLAEGLLNNVDRPPVTARDSDRVLYEGQALPHFNEVDECSGLDALITNRIWTKMGFEPETTLHDVRWGDDFEGRFVWVFEISGSVPPQHLIGGYAGAVSERQPPMYFPLGGGTIKGVSKPGWAIWSRIYVADGGMKADLGVVEVVELPEAETQRRWQATTPQWPIMHAVLPGISRDKMMGRHKSNHIQVAYVPDQNQITYALGAKLHAFRNLGIDVFLCGDGHEL